uniref:double-stranded RNA-binding protein 6-like n=1 Tax=Erigeron canadensis TaxID=72917 RepID=UPI001CB9C143|nr:double-stranded RNA-binding protein 6-like [Erigeron canadensis]
MPMTAPAPAPIASGSKPHLLYRCLLNQHAQKMRKSLPVYQTLNEGSDHLPKFRSTVTYDGESYTSSNTFPNVKMAEMNVSEIAYNSMIRKSKREALRHILEDKSICKSIVIEFSVKRKLERPKYVTCHQGGAIAVFSSQLSFNGDTFSGDNAKSIKEAEQLVARAVIHKYLDSEFASDMAEVINCKFRHAAEVSKFEAIHKAYNGTNVVVTQPSVPVVPTGPTTPATPVVAQACTEKVLTESTRPDPPVVTQPHMIEPVTTAAPVVTQPHIIKPITPAAHVLTQPQTAKVVTEPLTPATPVVTQPLTPKEPTKPITRAAPVETHPLIPKTEPITSTAIQPRIPKIEPTTHPSATVVTHPGIPKIEPTTPSTARTVPVVIQPRQEGIRPAVRRPAVLAPTTASAQVNMVTPAQHSGKVASNSTLDHFVEHKPLTARPVVFARASSAQVNMIASAPSSGQLASNLSSQRSMEHKRLTLQTSGRKRHWEDDKNTQKKTRVDTQRPVPGTHTSQSQPFRWQSSQSKGNYSRMSHKNASQR